MEPHWDLIKRIIAESDLVLEILDARLVELSRNEEAEKIVEEIGRPLIFVINKSDLVSKDILKKQVKNLMEKGRVVFVSAKSPRDIRILLYAIKKTFKEFGKRETNELDRRHRVTKGDIVVGVIGYPNVGKSSIINALAHKKKAKVGKKPGTTHGIHWIRATKEIRLIDSPGVIPLSKEDEIRYGLIGARDTENLKNPEIVANSLIKLFLKTNKKGFEKFYGIIIKEENPNYIIREIAIKKRYLIKGGNLDENRVCSDIIRDWQQGRLRL
ncbi:MAG: GTPase [Nanoarchaeota archaeon]